VNVYYPFASDDPWTTQGGQTYLCCNKLNNGIEISFIVATFLTKICILSNL